ncbi:MAG: metallophosphoesterase [Clostridia bacterium]|nr:metallophosphoesterase [Clostridia bacterium]
MNRRPSQSRTGYDSFSPKRASRFTAATPGNDFFDARRKKPLGQRLALYFFLFFLAVLTVNFVVNQFIHVHRIEIAVTGLHEDFDGYTLLHISDLKGASFGGSQGMLPFALGESEYDAVVLTGDMLSPHGNAQPFYALIEQLRAHNTAAPIYFISGDDDPDVTSESYFTGGSPFAPWVLGAQQRGAQLLTAPQSITRGDQSLWLTTISHLNLDVDTMQIHFEQQYLSALSSGDENAIELAAHNLKWLEETRAARKAISDNDAIITLTHTPPTADDLGGTQDSRTARIDLILCGHTLGGLIRLPLVGPVFIPSANLPRYGLLPGSEAGSALRRHRHTQVYVNPGLGSASDDYPPFFFRLFNPPAVTLITLTPSSI